MKKFLLSLLTAVLCVSAAYADVTLVVKDMPVFNGGGATMQTLPETWQVGDYSFEAKKQTGATAPAYNKAGDLRLFAKNTLTITCTEAMTKLVFNISSQGKKRLTSVTPSVGEVAEQATRDQTVTWTGNATSVTFTIGEKAIYGSDGESKAGQFDFTTIEVTGGSTNITGGSEPLTPNFVKVTSIESGSAYNFVASGKANALFDKNYGYMTANVVTISDDKYYSDPNTGLTFTEVEGGYTITTSGGKMLGAKAGFKTFDTTEESANNRVWTISFADGVATITNVGTSKIVAQDTQYGSFGCYDADALEGLKLPEIYKLSEETPDTPDTPDTPQPVTDNYTLASSIISGNTYVMVVDVDGVNKLANAISQTATYGRFNLSEVTVTDNMVTSDVVNAFTITSENGGYSLKDSYGRYVGFDSKFKTSFQLYESLSENCIWDITFADGKAVITNTQNESTATINVTKNASSGEWFTNLSLSVGATEYLLPALYGKAETGIESVVVDENAPVEYYNLQGIRVSNPENGLYIRRQGNVTTKVYVR